ncbi:Zn-dependent hydrolase [Desulfoluna limicola]|uniref:Zn-dependent hydrolase n=1 Tax=Desulfoluna limicola TaxID=2810562 RepID=A0ABM7PL39_9BACT|nr:MBL fold metallo-hydrolase [Desulfoluna limicola]BCS97811.1 Zn-dependent hydrolase [Desulfoluna limicola]
MNTLKFPLTVLSVFLLAGLAIGLSVFSATGGKPTAETLKLMKQSSQWSGKAFKNVLAQQPVPPFPAAKRFFLETADYSIPQSDVPVLKRDGREFLSSPVSGLRVTWFGHSTLLVEVEGTRVLIDPVWGERASPLFFMGAKRFFEPVMDLSDSPPIDAVVISHDHYDHLDMATVKALKDRPMTWIVPLGVGSHLAYWGVKEESIVELDWWESTVVGQTEFTATPARHNSGRSLFFTDTDKTLWAGWAIKGPTRSLFYSGDTPMHEGFVDIGDKLGPFDLSVMEVGAYESLWLDHHMGPEQAVMAHQLVGAKVMLPVHWGLFNLAAHVWTEPMERAIVAAQKSGVTLVAPVPGGSVDPMNPAPVDIWWPDLPWVPAEEKPIRSSAVEHLLQPQRLSAERKAVIGS